MDIFAAYPKLYGVVTAVRNLESYKNYKGPLVTVRDDFKLKDEFVQEYA